MTDPITPTAIARLLTPAQRAAQLALPADGTAGDARGGMSRWAIEARFVRMAPGHELVNGWRKCEWTLTPLGVRVRREVAGDG